jgi:hypothetical protein
MLRADLGKRSAPLYVWLVSAGKIEGPPKNQYPFLPCEHHTLIDILALNAAVLKTGTSIATYVYWTITQKTDFVQKVISQLNVGQSMIELERVRTDAILVTASHAQCDGRKISASFKQAAAGSGKKRAAVIKTSETELRRAWWNMAGFFLLFLIVFDCFFLFVFHLTETRNID